MSNFNSSSLLATTMELKRCLERESVAWTKVRGKMPGTTDHDRAAWLLWVEAAHESDVARSSVKKEVLTDRPWPVS